MSETPRFIDKGAETDTGVDILGMTPVLDITTYAEARTDDVTGATGDQSELDTTQAFIGIVEHYNSADATPGNNVVTTVDTVADPIAPVPFSATPEFRKKMLDYLGINTEQVKSGHRNFVGLGMAGLSTEAEELTGKSIKDGLSPIEAVEALIKDAHRPRTKEERKVQRVPNILMAYIQFERRAAVFDRLKAKGAEVTLAELSKRFGDIEVLDSISTEEIVNTVASIRQEKREKAIAKELIEDNEELSTVDIDEWAPEEIRSYLARKAEMVAKKKESDEKDAQRKQMAKKVRQWVLDGKIV